MTASLRTRPGGTRCTRRPGGTRRTTYVARAVANARPLPRRVRGPGGAVVVVGDRPPSPEGRAYVPVAAPGSARVAVPSVR